MIRRSVRFIPLILAALFVSSRVPSLRAANPPATASGNAPAAAASPDTYADVLEVPLEVRSALEEVLQAKVKALLAEKDKDGQPYRRGSFSKIFHRVDDSTYQAAFHRDTASKD